MKLGRYPQKVLKGRPRWFNSRAPPALSLKSLCCGHVSLQMLSSFFVSGSGSSGDMGSPLSKFYTPEKAFGWVFRGGGG